MTELISSSKPDATLPVNDLKRHVAGVKAEVEAAIAAVIASGWFVLGNEGKAFEEEFARYCGVPHAIGVANGTDAIEIAFRALGVGQGSRVAMVANAGYYGMTALAAVGGTPVYVDVGAHDHLMDLGALESALAGYGVDCILVTHLYGLLHDMEAVASLAARAGVPVLEDCAQAHGAERDGRRAGSFGAVACFSFFPTKNLGALGDGGAVVTADQDMAERIRQLRQYGWNRKYAVSLAGGRNSRLDEMQAAVLTAKLPHLDGWNARRRDIANRYSAVIDNAAITTPPQRGKESVGHLYVVRSERRDDLAAHLRAAGIATDIHYPIPDHLQATRPGAAEGVRLPVTERLAGEILTLPCFPEMTDAEVDRVIDAVNAW